MVVSVTGKGAAMTASGEIQWRRTKVNRRRRVEIPLNHVETGLVRYPGMKVEASLLSARLACGMEAA